MPVIFSVLYIISPSAILSKNKTELCLTKIKNNAPFPQAYFYSYLDFILY